MKHSQAKRSQYELKKLADFWLDLSKIILISFVVKFFETGTKVFSWSSLVTMMAGLFFSILSANIGLRFAKKVNHD